MAVRAGRRRISSSTMTYRAVLRGYLLEEALAWLLRNSGYRLLVHANQDPDELKMDGNTLLVQGRGTTHQVDVLGEFTLTPAFSLPIRMFVEAKYYRTPCELPVLRNALGVIEDVNENFAHLGGSRPRRRYQYVYALFSASGFTSPAQAYALAQQISLVDLSGASFAWLRKIISSTASELYAERNQHRITRFPVSWMRQAIRGGLGTAPQQSSIGDEADGLSAASTIAPRFRAAAEVTIDKFVDALRSREKAELLLGFPAAPFILTLAADDPDRFIEWAERHPTHAVRLRRSGSGKQAEWAVTPWDDQDAYRLTFKLPARIESWISENEERRERIRVGAIKEDFLPEISIYRRHGEDMRIYQLRYQPSALHRPV
jgi:hypothetical protein